MDNVLISPSQKKAKTVKLHMRQKKPTSLLDHLLIIDSINSKVVKTITIIFLVSLWEN